MKTTNAKVIELWAQGMEAENHSGSLKSIKVNSKHFLVGYDWAVYGYKWYGQFYLYQDWHGYSRTTSKHWNMMQIMASQAAGPAGVCVTCEGAPTVEKLKEEFETLPF